MAEIKKKPKKGNRKAKYKRVQCISFVYKRRDKTIFMIYLFKEKDRKDKQEISEPCNLQEVDGNRAEGMGVYTFL